MTKLFIFDMDGVLIDSEPFHFEVLDLIFQRYDLQLTEPYYNSLVGTANIPMWERIKKDFDLQHDLTHLITAHKDFFYSHLKGRSIPSTPNVAALLERIKSLELSCSLASSSPEKLIQIFTEQLGFAPYFDYLVSGEHVKRSKPEPDIFLKVAALYGRKPSDFVVIEDSSNGVMAAKRAGMYCIGYQNPNSGNQDLKLADMIISDFNQITTSLLKSF